MRLRRYLLAILTSALIFTGCHARSPQAAPPSAAISSNSLDAAASDARKSNRPLVILVIDPGRGPADRSALAAFQLAIANDSSIIAVALDLTLSRNRAAAAPLHALLAPTLITESPAGVITSRDDLPITADLIRQRIEQAKQQGPQLDHQLAQLTAAAANPADVTAQMNLATFLLAHANDQQAIAPLQAVAQNQNADLPTRIQAWVAVGKAHLWDIEPEKARHSAQSLIATLGPQSPDAVAGGNLVRGLQDTRAKRYDRAREEFNAAVAASPNSNYGKEAQAALAQLPVGGK